MDILYWFRVWNASVRKFACDFQLHPAHVNKGGYQVHHSLRMEADNISEMLDFNSKRML
jgi:hypothetical protein